MTFEELNNIPHSISEYEILYDKEFSEYNIDNLRQAVRIVREWEVNAREDFKYLAIKYRPILEKIGLERVAKILSGDEEICRHIVMEKIARQAAAEMCVNGKYDVETFHKMSSLPIDDFKLVTKRIVEIVSMANDVSNQAMNIGVAGV